MVPEVAVPWADLQIPPGYPLRMTLILADQGHYRNT